MSFRGSKRNKLKMHDLILDMGQEIIREGSFSNPGKRTRLWQSKEIETVLLNHIISINNTFNLSNNCFFKS